MAGLCRACLKGRHAGSIQAAAGKGGRQDMPDPEKKTEQYHTLPKDMPAPEQKAPPRSAYLEELLRRNAEAEIIRWERPRPVDVHFRIPVSERGTDPGNWYAGDVTVQLAPKDGGGLDILLRGWNEACAFRTPGETWFITCSWRY